MNSDFIQIFIRDLLYPLICKMNFYRYTATAFFFAVIVNNLFAQGIASIDFFTKAAEQNSPMLNEYKNQVISAKIDSVRLRATYGFIISGEGNALYAPVLRGWGYDNALSNGQSLFVGLRATKEFIGRNNLQTRLNAYNRTVTQLIAQSAITKRTLYKQVNDQYIATYASQQQFMIAEEITHLLEQEDIVLKKLTQEAVFKQTDYLNFKVNLQQNQLALQQRRAEWQSNYVLLNYICGIADTVFHTLSEPSFSETKIDSFDSSVYAEAFLADSAKLVTDAAIIHYDYKPKISGFSDGGYQSSFILAPYKNFGVSMGIAISLPLYDGHKKKMLLNQNQIQLDSRKKYYEQAKTQYDQQIFLIQNQLKQYRRIIKTANEQIVYARTLTEANAKQLPTGDVKIVDFILSINNLLNLRSNIIQYTATVYNLQNQLHYLILQ